MTATGPSDGSYRVCSVCRTPIPFLGRYYRCSVSTCNRNRTALYFCSVPCWDAHLPEARHRDAWAEEARAPSREAFEAAERASEQAEATMTAEKPPERKIVAAPPDQVPREILIIASRLKAYVRARSGFNTSDAVMDVLSNHLRRICDQAIDHASLDGRKTVLDRDVTPYTKIMP